MAEFSYVPHNIAGATAGPRRRNRPIHLSILDTVMIGSGFTTHEAFDATIRLARRAETLGFCRYWMAEHHGVPGVGSSAPVVTISALAAATQRIHVGSGGVMLPNHIPLIVAEQFSTLAALYPGRIDLGVGASATEPRASAVLARALAGYGVDDFPERVGELAGFLSGEFPETHPDHGIVVSPRSQQPPVIWILGASVHSAEIAASLGLPFAFGHHFGRSQAGPALEHYRRTFRPSAVLSQPYTIVTAHVICATTDEEADGIARSAELMFRRLSRGQPGMLPSPEEVAVHQWTPDDLAFIEQRRRGQAIGSPQTVRQALKGLLQATGADELMMTTQMYRLEDRVRSIELVSDMFAPTGTNVGSFGRLDQPQ